MREDSLPQRRLRRLRVTAAALIAVALAVVLGPGAGATAAFRMNWPPVLAHIHSTLRMGSRTTDSVLDEYTEARAVARLFVADNSALPNSAGGANPTLTTQALATRTAERIVRRYLQGDAWVVSTEPVSSIAPTVTAAVAALT